MGEQRERRKKKVNTGDLEGGAERKAEKTERRKAKNKKVLGKK